MTTSITFENEAVSVDDFQSLCDEFKMNYSSLAGQVVAVVGDYSLTDMVALFSLLEMNCIVVPLKSGSQQLRTQISIAEPQWVFFDGKLDEAASRPKGNPHYLFLQNMEAPGVVVFSSGSTGPPKGIVINLKRYWDKFGNYSGEPIDTVASVFLGFDHLGGINSWLPAFLRKQSVVFLEGLGLDKLCQSIKKYSVEILPVTPSLLNFLLISGAFGKYDFSTIKMISYGSEPVNAEVLEKVHNLFPDIEFKQTYGLSELGVPRTISKSSGSAFFRIDDARYIVKICDDQLYIKTDERMVGYLNAPDPFDYDGWFATGDEVEVDSDGYYRVVGRDSEVINVGGSKVYPIEIEQILARHPAVQDVSVFGIENQLLGRVVGANVIVRKDWDASDQRSLRLELKSWAASQLESYKVPVSMDFISSDQMYSGRGKKLRRRAVNV